MKNRATQQVVLDRLEWLVTGDKADSLAVFCRKGKRGYLNCYTGEVVIPAQYERGLGVFGRIGGCDVGREDRFYRPARTDGYPADLELSGR